MLRKFLRATNGNLAITFALAIVPIVFGLGAASDYGYAAKLRARMEAAADAAALAAVTPQNMSQSTTLAATAATQLFNSQVTSLPRLVYSSTSVTNQCVTGTNGTRPASGYNLCVQVTDALVDNQRVRTAVVAFSAGAQTAFTNVLHVTQLGIGGSSTATASTSPNIDFYLMVDTSPSMAIPATTTGINWMVSNTSAQGGCAFACHEKYPAKDNLGNPGGEDNYALARANSIVLRMDLVTQAISDLVTTAQSTAASTGAAYRMAAYTFDAAIANPITLQTPTSTTQTQANNIQMLEVDYNNVLNGSSNSDEDTNFDTAFTTVNSAMTTAGAGTGTNTTGDKPQQVLMIVTDGVSDENWSSQRIYLPLGGTTTLSAQSTNWCTQIKSNANVRIAVLYLTYNPLPSNSWYTTYIAPEQSQISPTLQNCASSGLFFQVNTDGDVSAAMNTLFETAVKTARLSN